MYINSICDLLLPDGMNNIFRGEVVDYKWCFASSYDVCPRYIY